MAEFAGTSRERAIDAVMSYWLNGTEDESLLEWWTSSDAAAAAGEIVDAVLAVTGDGWRVVARDLAWSLTGVWPKTTAQITALDRYDAAVLDPKKEQQ